MKKYLLILFAAFLGLNMSYGQASKKFTKLYSKGKTFYGKINYEEAIPYFEQAETEAKKNNQKDTLYSILLVEMAESYYNLKNQAKAESYYTAALSTIEQVSGKESPAYLKALTGNAKLYYRTQRFAQAEALYLKAVPLFDKLNQKKTTRYSETLTAIGNIYLQRGEYSKAEPYYTEAATVIKAVKGTDNIEYVSTLNNLAVIYSILTDYDKAEKTYAELLKAKAAVSGKQSADYATSLANRGTLYFNLNQNKAAETDLEEALKIYEKNPGKESPAYATTLNNLGVVYKSNEEFGKSKQAFTEALAIREKNPGKESSAYATTLHNMGVLYDDAGEFDRAIPFLKEAKDIREKIFGKNHPDYVASLDEIGLNTLYLEKYPEAKPYFLESVSTNLNFISQNFPGMSEKEKSGFVNNYGKYFDHFYAYGAYAAGYRGFEVKTVTPLNDNDLYSEWYNTRLATKGLILNSVQKTRTRILGSGDAALIEKFNKWEKLKNQIAQSTSLTIAERSQKNIDLAKLKAEADQEEKELSTLSEAFKKVYDPAPVSWKDVKAKLKKDEAAIEIIRIVFPNDTIYSALIVTSDAVAPQPVLITNGKNLEKKYFKYYQNCIRFKIIDEVTYDAYWKPIATKLKSLGKFTRVYLSLDGIYNQINPATLFNPESNKYLGEETELYLLSTTKELSNAPFASLNKKKALLIGDPDFRLDNSTELQIKTEDEEVTRSYKGTYFSDLPGTEKEIRSINTTLTAFGWKTQIFNRQEAVEEKIKMIKYPSLVHIATHGFFMSSNNKDVTAPMLSSGVAFAGVNAKPELKKEDDGVLTAYEAMNLQLDSTDLVVLSACETGLGEVKTGEGVYGIQRGLRVAGAKTIVMSLWKVDDAATQELMSTFYKEWIATGSKHLAFSKAQAAMKKKYVYPYYWGAFVMVGE